MAGLPERLAVLASRWDLVIDSGALWHGYHAVVLPARRGERRLALKLVWPPGIADLEVLALEQWQGRGSVELVAADRDGDGLLLEWLDAARCLRALPVMDAAVVLGSLARTLAVPVPVGAPFPSLATHARELLDSLPRRQDRLGRPVPTRWMAAAIEQAAELACCPEQLLVHCDLHGENILASDRPESPWVAIDPKPAVGQPERSVAELLWTRVDELADARAIGELLAVVVQAGELDRARAISWGFVRSIDYWLWGLEHGLTDDPRRCQRIAEALAPLR